MPVKHLLAAALLAAGTSAAFAHAVVRQSSPAAGAALATSPKEVTITFNEKVETMFSTATLKNAAGAKVPTEKVKVDAADPATLHLAVPVLKPGKYVVSWTAVGRDGHRRTGDIRFSIN